jgi:elongation factor P
MRVATATNIRKGQILNIEQELWVVLDVKHITPGNWRGYVQVTMKQLKTGRKDNRRFRSTDKIDIAFIETRELQYLYGDNLGAHFMDTETYEQSLLDRELVEDAMPFLSEGDLMKVSVHDGVPVGVELPTTVILEVTETEPGIKGNTVSNVFKPAKLSTGHELKVPNHVNQGDMIKVDTRTGEFVERA